MDRLQVKTMALALAVFNLFALIPAGYTFYYLWTNNMRFEFSSIMEMHQQVNDAWVLYILPFLATGMAILLFREFYYRVSKLTN